MRLINPAALFFLGLIPVLILIHSLKPRPILMEVTNLFLWQDALREKRGGVNIQRIIKNLPLLFQILAVLFGSVALAKPVWLYSSDVKGDVILVIDASASMKTRTASGIRFDRAKEEALRLVSELPREKRTLLIVAGHNPTILSPLSSDHNKLRRIIQDLSPSDEPGRLEKALYLALSFVDPEREDRVFLITDGAGGEFAGLDLSHRNIQPIIVRGGERNVGITKFEIRPVPDLEGQYEIMLELKNFNPHPVLCPIHLTIEDVSIVKKTVGLRAMERKLLIFSHSGPLSGTVHARLELNDDFPTDNEAFAVLDSSQDVWVLLVSKGNFFLEKLLEAFPNFMVNSVKEIIPSSWKDQTTRHDIVILDRISPPSTERGNFLMIEALSPSIPLSRVGEEIDPEILDWDRKSPLTANLDLSGVLIDVATRVTAGENLRPLLESTRTGLMYSYEKNGLRAVYIGFDLQKSDLPLKVAFPVLMGNIMEWLQPDKLRFQSSQVKSGRPFPIFLNPLTDTFSVSKPSGQLERFRRETNPYGYTGTDEVGLYTLEEGDQWRTFAVNLLDIAESDIRVAPREDPSHEITMDSESKPVPMELGLWVFFLLSVSALLFLEWVSWLRSR